MKMNIKKNLKELGIRPNRALGQNFLKDGKTAKRMVSSADLSPDETVLEIGPGLGILTDEIVEQAKKTVVVEKDDKLAEYLREKYSEEDQDLDIIKGDVLEIELPYFDKVISNLPFSISSPLTFKLLHEEFEIGILTYQKQYAQRMIAKAGEGPYSRLSVMVSTLADVEILFDISRRNFHPPPDVDGSVVRLKPREPDFDIIDEEVFAKVVKELFNYRRKKIKNALKTGLALDVDSVPFGEKRVGNIKPEDINVLVNHLIDEDMISSK